MIKVITMITKFIIVTITALFFASCNFANLNSIRGNGHVTTEKRTVNSDFKSVEVSNGIELVVEQADHIDITVEADENLQKEISTKVENGVLIISCDYNSFINIKSKKVIVKMPVIERLEASSGSNIKSVSTIKGDHINVEASSGSEIVVNLEAETIICDASSGSAIEISGIAIKVDHDASSGSEINAKNLLANDINVDSSSGSSVTVHPLVSLIADASSASEINYVGTPKKVTKDESSGSSINKV